MRKELKQGAYVVGVWLIIKVLSHMLSFNQQGEIYKKYYYSLWSFSFLDLLLILYLLRTVIVLVIHFYGNRPAKG